MARNRTLKINRLLDIVDLLNANPEGLSARQIAEKTGRTVRTIFRDFKTFSNDLNVTLNKTNGKWKVLPGDLLPPIRFNYNEAIILFSAMRVFLSLTSVYNPVIGNTFSKLNSILPSPMNNQIKQTISWIKTHKQYGYSSEIIFQLSRAWLEGRRIKIEYYSILSNTEIDSVVEIYLIQPIDRIRGIWIVGYCPLQKKIEMFNLARIRKVEFLRSRYSIPEAFNPVSYQFPVWKYDRYEKVQKIILKFRPEMYSQMHETIWQFTRNFKVQPDRSIIATFVASPNMSFKLFVLEFGRMVEVLEPAKLRKEILEIAKGVVSIYENGK